MGDVVDAVVGYNPITIATDVVTGGKASEALGVSGIFGSGGIMGQISGAGAIEDATNAQVASANKAIATQYQMFKEAQAANEPYATAGENALDKYLRMAKKTPGAKVPKLNLPTLDEVAEMYKTLPGYQERLAEGIRARDMSASASGRLGGGGYLKELERYAQDYASNEFGNTYNQLYQNALNKYNAGMDRYNAAWTKYQNKLNPYYNVMALGQNAAAGTGNNAMQTGVNVANTQMAAGDALAMSAVNQVNARNQLLSNVLNVGGMLAGA